MNFLGIPDIVLSKTSKLSLNAGFYIIEIYISSFCRRSIINKSMHECILCKLKYISDGQDTGSYTCIQKQKGEIKLSFDQTQFQKTNNYM